MGPHKDVRSSQVVRQWRLHTILSQGEGVGFWDFNGKEDNLQKDGKSKCLVNEYLLCHGEKLSDVKQTNKQTNKKQAVFGDISLPDTDLLSKLFYFRQLRGGKKLLLTLLGLDCLQLKIIYMPK